MVETRIYLADMMTWEAVGRAHGVMFKDTGHCHTGGEPPDRARDCCDRVVGVMEDGRALTITSLRCTPLSTSGSYPILHEFLSRVAARIINEAQVLPRRL